MEEMKKPKLIVIVGRTASGKSDVAVKLAEEIGGEIISADSRQVYTGLDIGTGKITKREMKGVKHHLLDIADPKKQFTASDFVNLTNSAIAEVVNRSKVPIICGGTGFYIDALLGEKQVPEVLPNPKLRKTLENKSVEELFKILEKLDKDRAKNIDAKNPRRLIRAIEICEALGSVPKFESQDSKSNNELQKKFKIIKIGIKIEDQELKERINKRIQKWLRQGLIQEVENLHKKGLSWKRMAAIGLEYKLVAEFLQNKITKEKMIERMQIETWHYAKRQKTWFKKSKNIKWVEIKNSLTSSFIHLI